MGDIGSIEELNDALSRPERRQRRSDYRMKVGWKIRLHDWLGLTYDAYEPEAPNIASSNREAVDIVMQRIPSPGPMALRRLIGETEFAMDERATQIETARAELETLEVAQLEDELRLSDLQNQLTEVTIKD